ncbi:MAG: hypothetical protein WC516_04360 [Patescibacteria group bacterium]|jgi:hypothetical protein
MSQKTGCPKYINKYIDENNCLLTINPKLCKEWDHDKNKLVPDKYAPNSKEKFGRNV